LVIGADSFCKPGERNLNPLGGFARRQVAGVLNDGIMPATKNLPSSSKISLELKPAPHDAPDRRAF
jgi:hypothetical protein